MDRQDQLRYCKACSHHRFDASKGIICSITNDQASFTETCTSYKEDSELKHQMEMQAIRNQINCEEAGKGTRFANYLIDVIVLYALTFVIGMVLAIIMLVVSPDSIEVLDSQLLSYVIFISTGILYYTLFEATTGRIIGKYITGSKVINQEGHMPSWNEGFIRSVSRFVPFDAISFLGDIGWHDKWSDTKVVKK